MYDIERIGELISDVDKLKAELKGFGISKKEDLLDSKSFHAASMVVFAILNRVIDLGNEMLFSENLGSPKSYQDIMPKLAKAGFMNKKTSDELNTLIKQRNILAHFYGEISEDKLYRLIKKLFLVEDFVSRVKERVNKSGNIK